MVPWRQLWFWWVAPERANPPQNLGSSIDSRQQSTGLGIDVSIAPNGNYPFAHLSLSFLFLTCADHRSFLASFKVGAPAPRWQVKAGAGGGSWATYQSWSFWPFWKVGVIAVAFSFLQTTIIVILVVSWDLGSYISVDDFMFAGSYGGSELRTHEVEYNGFIWSQKVSVFLDIFSIFVRVVGRSTVLVYWVLKLFLVGPQPTLYSRLLAAWIPIWCIRIWVGGNKNLHFQCRVCTFQHHHQVHGSTLTLMSPLRLTMLKPEEPPISRESTKQQALHFWSFVSRYCYVVFFMFPLLVGFFVFSFLVCRVGWLDV